ENRKLHHVARFPGIEMCGPDDSATLAAHAVIHLPAFAAHLNATAAAAGIVSPRHNEIQRPVFPEVHRREPGRGGDEQFVSLGCVGVLMKVETPAASLSR